MRTRTIVLAILTSTIAACRTQIDFPPEPCHTAAGVGGGSGGQGGSGGGGGEDAGIIAYVVPCDAQPQCPTELSTPCASVRCDPKFGQCVLTPFVSDVCDGSAP